MTTTQGALAVLYIFLVVPPVATFFADVTTFGWKGWREYLTATWVAYKMLGLVIFVTCILLAPLVLMFGFEP